MMNGIHPAFRGADRHLLAAWWGSRTLALMLFAVTFVASVATYLHHATDKLNLSF
jgi:hypothetical protein